MKNTAWWAKEYTGRYGLHLVPVEPNRKFPRSNDWGNKTITDPLIAESFWRANPDWNMGIALGPSRICSLDIDCMPSFEIICEAFGVNLKQLISDYPTMQGRPPNMRIMFRVPEGVDLPYIKLNWKPEADPRGEKHRELMGKARELVKRADAANTQIESDKLNAEAELLREQAKPFAAYTVFELRSACDGTQKQDIAVPSVHPDTGKPYVWLTEPKGEIKPPPAWLLTVWREFNEKFKTQFLSACPWADIEEVYKAPTTPATRHYSEDGGLVAVANAYSAENSITEELTRQGYKHVHGNRWISPYSGTGLPGVVVFDDSNRAWIHHASDPLCSDESKQPVSPFDLFCEYEHAGDFVRAAKSIAKTENKRFDTPSFNMIPAGGYDEVVHDEARPISTYVDIATPLPWTNSKGKPYKHIDNLRDILNRIGAVVRYNVMRKEEEIIIPNKVFSQDNEANASYAYLTSLCSLFDFGTDKNQEFLTYLADENQYSPVVEWITSKPWDGVSRLERLYNTVTTPGSIELRNILIKRWMLSAISAAFSQNGVDAQGVLIFQGSQNVGKTSWLMSLVPDEVNSVTKMVQDGLMLRPDDKDSVKAVVSYWLVELGEIDSTFRKADIAQLKAFVTRKSDKMRLPYARKESTFARRTVLFGSVNPREFLQDDTGNRRYWTIETTALDIRHGLDMQQVWAELLELWKAGERHYLTPDESALLNISNEDFQASDPIEERILSGFNWDSETRFWDYMRATDALLACGIDRPTRADAIKAGMVIRKLNGDMSKRCGKNGRMLLVPQRKVGF